MNTKLMAQNEIQIKSGKAIFLMWVHILYIHKFQYPKSVVIYDEIIDVTKIIKLFKQKPFSRKTVTKIFNEKIDNL